MQPLVEMPWLPAQSRERIAAVTEYHAAASVDDLAAAIERLAAENRAIHEQQSINLNPATNVMNPRAEALLAGGMGTRPSLGYPGDKYEMGLEAIEEIEVIANGLVCELFQARYAELRLASGSMANLYAFMATCKPGDAIIVPPPTIGGHVTHHASGAAGLYGLTVHHAPVDATNYTVDVDALHLFAQRVRPKLITIGGSLNLFPHPVRELRAVADEVGCYLLFDAAHLSGMIAGGAWPNPLKEGAHLMSFSTYKSLGGPPAGVLVTNDAKLAQRIDKIAFPGLTANYDAAKTAALAMALLDWKEYGTAYAATMAATAQALASALRDAGLPLFAAVRGGTTSHQFALEAQSFGGGQRMAKLLRRANILTCGIGLPIESIEGDLNGLRLGTPEVARWGMAVDDMPTIADFFKRALLDGEAPTTVGEEVSEFRQHFQQIHFIRP